MRLSVFRALYYQLYTHQTNNGQVPKNTTKSNERNTTEEVQTVWQASNATTNVAYHLQFFHQFKAQQCTLPNT